MEQLLQKRGALCLESFIAQNWGNSGTSSSAKGAELSQHPLKSHAIVAGHIHFFFYEAGRDKFLAGVNQNSSEEVQTTLDLLFLPAECLSQ